MTPIALPLLNASAALPATTREDISFTQRHAWMREYEHAEQGARQGADAGQPQSGASDGQARAAMAGPATHVATTVLGRALAASRVTPTPSSSARTVLPNGKHTMPGPSNMGEVVTSAAWLASATSGAPRSGPADATTWAAGAHAQRPKNPKTEDPSEREVTVARLDDSLSVTVRDASLDARDAREILRALNASGASRGIASVQVTVNGHSASQHTPTPLSTE